MNSDSAHVTDEKGSDIHKVTAIAECTHSRMVDDVLTTSKKGIGKVYCLACHAVFDHLFIKG